MCKKKKKKKIIIIIIIIIKAGVNSNRVRTLGQVQSSCIVLS